MVQLERDCFIREVHKWGCGGIPMLDMLETERHRGAEMVTFL